MQHLQPAGPRGMEIDHFDPREKRKYRQRYDNLFLTSRHCNGAKSDTWPSRQQQKAEVRFLNPCEESDYGEQIFEDPNTHLLVGTTPAARFHIRVCDLNAPHLVNERERRARLGLYLNGFPVTATASYSSVLSLVQEVRSHLTLLIPPIPPPPSLL